MSEGDPRHGGYICSAAALMLLIWSIFTVGSWHVSADEQTVEGTIVALQGVGDSEKPVFEFVHPDTGQVESVTATSSGLFLPSSIGERADIVIDSNGNAGVRGALSSVAILLIFASVFGSAGGYLLLKEPKRRLEQEHALLSASPQDRLVEYPQDQLSPYVPPPSEA